MNSSDPSTGPEVRTASGRVRGRWRPTTGTGRHERSAAFLGVPSPSRPSVLCALLLRFRKRLGRACWTPPRSGPRAAGRSGRDADPRTERSGRRTLNVNVYTPSPTEAAPGDGLPVLVYFHGGGYFAGSPASPWYDGRNFNRDGVVTVTLSYRLGFDGFGWMESAPANRGVRDWLLGLEWVQHHIAAFGGDPRRVTIVGQSAGGGAVLTLQWQNYVEIWQRSGMLTWLKNTAILSVTITALQVLTGSFAAYGFSKAKFAGRHVLFLVYIGTIAVPWQSFMIPQFVLVSEFKLSNTLWSLIILQAFGAFGCS